MVHIIIENFRRAMVSGKLPTHLACTNLILAFRNIWNVQILGGALPINIPLFISIFFTNLSHNSFMFYTLSLQSLAASPFLIMCSATTEL